MDPRPTLLDTTLNVNIAMQDAVANHFCDDEGPSVDTHPSTRPRSRPKSTRELVSRFEALSVTVPVSAATTPATAPRRLERAPSTKAASQSASAAKTAPSQPERAPNGKATSIQRTPSKTLPALPKEPLATQPSRFQKSWQNLLGVLGRRDAPTDTPRAPRAISIKRRTTSTQAEVNFTGPLLVLVSGDDSVPQWIACMAKLRGRSLHIMPDHDADGRMLSLATCNDVRSLARSDVDDVQSSTLSSGPTDAEPKVFQLVFDNGTTERFAAASIQARAVWVNTLWDAILQVPVSRLSTTVPTMLMLPKSVIQDRPSRPPPTVVMAAPRPHEPSISARPPQPRVFSKPSNVAWRPPASDMETCKTDTDSLLDAYRTSRTDSRASFATSPEPSTPSDAAVARLTDQVSALYAEIERMSANVAGTHAQITHEVALVREEVRAARVGAVSGDALAGELLRVAQGVGALGGDVRAVREVLDTSAAYSKGREDALDCRLGEVIKQVAKAQAVAMPPPDLGSVEQKLETITELLVENQATVKSSNEHEIENGRYLAEMCTWLDAFVKYSTSNHEQMGTTLEQLLAWLQAQARKPQAPPIAKDVPAPDHGLAITMPTDADAFARSMNELIATVQTSLGTDARARDTLYHALLQQLPERQKRDQTQMIQKLAAELSADIKGERLRFVDAMKEATTLNVHLHVEQFKTNLGREVHVMTQEVVRLQRERDMLEQRIDELRRGQP